MKRNIIIDGQILQTNAWHRGMGKYTLQIIHELSEVVDDDFQVSIVFNKSIECDGERFEVIKYLCPKAKLYHTDLPLPKDNEVGHNMYVKRLTDYIEEEFKGLDNYYIVSSLFSFSFFADYPENCHKALIFYDLTPLLFWKDLGGYFPPHLYMKRFTKIYEADMIFSISETTKNDLVRIFGISQDRITNINGGFTKLSAHETQDEKLKLPARFILCPTGDLPHKNNLLAAEGFEVFNKRNKNMYSLLITSTFSDKSKKDITGISKNIIFTGNLSDEELESLYEKSDALLFSSKYEGLGIPVLDAAANNKPIVASKIPVFEEMTSSAFYFFDPNDKESLADALGKAISKDKFKAKVLEYPAIMEKYTWARTRKALLLGVDKYDAREISKVSPTLHSNKIALVCVNPGIAGQIGRIAESLYPSLSLNYQVDFFFDSKGLQVQQMERPTFLDYIGSHTSDIRNLTFRKYRTYEAVVYLLDDLSLDSIICQYASVLPGVLFSNFTNDKSNKVLEQVITDNQSVTKVIPVQKLTDYEWMSEAIISTVENRTATAEEMIIKEKRLNRSIMKKLMSRMKQ